MNNLQEVKAMTEISAREIVVVYFIEPSVFADEVTRYVS